MSRWMDGWIGVVIYELRRLAIKDLGPLGGGRWKGRLIKERLVKQIEQDTAFNLN